MDSLACPFCRESINPSAIKCSHCKEFLPGAPKNRTSAERTVVPDLLALVGNRGGRMKTPRVFLQRFQASRFAVFFLTLLVAAFSSSSVFGRCGVQRWDVKTGTDAQATSINLTFPTPTTIAFLTDLARFPAPAHWPPPSRIAPEETTLWILDAILDSYKFENDPNTGDSDYHLFIKDDAGNTMVAEIPFPGCTSGSVWASQIATARATFDAQFTATGSFKSAQNMPVRITGIGMFDKPAHGSGHSPNGMEIHPILRIEFNPGTPVPTVTPEPPVLTPATPVSPAVTSTPTPTPPPGAGGTHDLIVNGGFEDGELGWSASPGVISNQAQAHSGFLGRLAGRPRYEPHGHTLADRRYPGRDRERDAVLLAPCRNRRGPDPTVRHAEDSTPRRHGQPSPNLGDVLERGPDSALRAGPF
jgi:hypothetical protein